MSDSTAGSAPRRRIFWTVRTRIVTAITLVTALGLLAVGVSVYLVERHRILEQVDVRLAANLESARFLVENGSPDGGQWNSSSDALAGVVQRMSPDDNTGAMGMADGVITIIPGVDLDVDLQHESAFAAHVQSRQQSDQALLGTYAEQGVVWRYLAVPIAIEGSPEPASVTFVMVYDLAAELGEFDAAARAFAVVSAIVLVVVAATGTIVASRLLRPLRDMHETANRINAESLSERLPIRGNDDVAELAITMNDMLDRLDNALESQKSLLSDVGHELKTPITIVRGHVELMDPLDPQDARETRSLVLDELDRMGRLVQDLATAASLHGPAPVQLVLTDAAQLVDQVARKAAGIAGADVETVDRADVVVSLDPARITQALLQLAQNAVTYGGGRMQIGSAIVGHRIEFRVRDFGPGVPEVDEKKVFERFHRGSRADEASGSGLGLSIVQMIARAHGGDASVRPAPGGGALFCISVPLRSHSADYSAQEG